MKPLCDCGKELHKVLENINTDIAIYMCLFDKNEYRVDKRTGTITLIKEVENGRID
jgi:hypothetical protein